MRRRVVITGMGAVTPLGNSVKELYENQLAGKSGIDFIRNFDASTFPTKFAAELKIYGRKGLPCRRCRTPIEVVKISGRGSYFCPQCQS